MLEIRKPRKVEEWLQATILKGDFYTSSLVHVPPDWFNYNFKGFEFWLWKDECIKVWY